MTTLILPRLIVPSGGGGPIVLHKVTYGVATGTNPNITLNLSANKAGRLLGVFCSNEEVSFNSVYASGVTAGAVGLVEVTGVRQSTSSTVFKNQFFWGVNEADEGDTTFAVAIGSSDFTQVVCFEMTGAKNSAPIGATASKETPNGDTDCTYPITPTKPNSLIICGSHCRKSSATPAADMIEDIDENPQSDFVVWAGHRYAPPTSEITVGCTTDGSNLSSRGASAGIEILEAA